MRAFLTVLALLGLALIGLFWQGREGARTAQELSTVKEAVQEAVVAREAILRVDVQQEKERAVAWRSVRSAVVLAKENSRNESRDVGTPVECADPVGDAERLRLLNGVIAEVNRVIAVP